MKTNILSLFFLIFHLSASAQTSGTIRGTVSSSDGNPAEFVNVSLEGTTKGTVADRNGAFEIKNVKPGTYTVVASFVGLGSQKKRVDVGAGETVTVDFIMEENAQRLDEIVVSGSRLGSESPFVSRMPLKNIENPQVYSSVSSDLLKVQAITNFDDALKNVPGVHKLWESTGRASG